MKEKRFLQRVVDNKDNVGSLLILAFSLFYFKVALDLPSDPTANDETFTPATLPLVLAIAAIGFSLLQLALPSTNQSDPSVSSVIRGFRWKPALGLILWMSLYAASFSFLGFVPASIAFLFLGFVTLGERRWWLIIALSAGLIVFMWVIFTQVFGLYLSPGQLFQMISGQAY